MTNALAQKIKGSIVIFTGIRIAADLQDELRHSPPHLGNEIGIHS